MNSNRILAIFSTAILSTTCFQLSAATYNVGAGQTYATLNSVPALNPGDLVQIFPGTYYETFRVTRAGTSSSPIVIRGVGTTRPVFDGTGLDVTGALPNPRAIFQVEASYVTLDNIEIKNAANGNNGAGVRVTNTSGTTTFNTTISNCKITFCDMGMMSDSNDNLLITGCEVAFNGTSLYSGYSHNFYLNGNKTTVQYCYIHDAQYGQNFKTRGHYTELFYNCIANSQDGEVCLVDSALTATANSNAVMIGNIVISKVRLSGWNNARFIWFGMDSGGSHTGVLYAFNNTCYTYDSRSLFINANATGSSAVLQNNLFYGANNIAAGTLSGSNNWMPSSAIVPSGVSGSVLGSNPLFVNPGARDFHLSSGSQCIDAGNGALTYFDGNGAAHSGAPSSEYVVDLGSVARSASGTIDIGAYEYHGAVIAPSITGQPASQTVTAGQTATFSVTASGTAPLTYQWQKNGANISGASGATYTTLATTTADSGSTFRCVVSNSAGSATSNSATLTVNSSVIAPSITAQPVSQTVTAGQTATFTVTASGTAPLTYQWQKNGANISGATSATYTTPATTTADSGSTFRCVVSNSAGSATSNSATLTVNSSVVAPSITAQPVSKTVTAGQTATFTVTASGTAPLTYQWQKNGANISGATSATYTTPATTTADSGSTFRCVVSNSAGSATSNSATLTVNSSVIAPTIAAQPVSQTVTAGQTATFTVTASGTAPLTYQWQKNGANISGATSATYTTPATTTADSGSTFRCVVSNSAGSATSNSATLTVNSGVPVITSAATANPSSPLVGQSVTLSVAASDADGDTLTYTWAFGDGGTGSGASATHTYTTAGTYTATATVSDGHGNSITSSVTLTVNSSSSTGPVLYWKLDETSGVVAMDSSGNGYTGTVVNGGTWTSGQVNGALGLSGASQYAITANNLSSQFASGSVTLALWVKANAAGVIVDELGQAGINTGWHDSQIEVASDGSVYARVWNLPGVLLGKITLGQWAHVALRYDSAAQKLDGFLNGVQSTASVSGTKQWPGSLYYALGSSDGTNLGSGGYFNGALDDFHVYNRALSVAEVSALMGTAPTASAAYVKTDASTQGNWKGAYGGDGYAIQADSTNYPSYATVSFAGNLLYTWASSTSDVRAPQKAASSTDRIAACWYNNPSYTIDVNLTDGRTHPVALYCLDWDTNSRAQTFTITDAGTGAVLDGPRALSSFNGGDYVVWNIKGHVKITLKCTGGYNAVLSGIFFGPGAGNGGDIVWVEDSIPAGGVAAADSGDSWNWVASNPAPYSGTLASQSNIAAGEHQHYFSNATQTLAVNTGDTLIAYVYLDPVNVPSEIMLQWNNGNWNARAYWGANNIAWGTNGTNSLRYMGALPAAGQWVRLQVPASQVGLEGSTLTGMAFTLYGGRATWDHAGKVAGVAPAVAASTTPVDTAAPAPADSTGTLDAPVNTVIDLGSVKVNQPFKLKLALPAGIPLGSKVRTKATGLPQGVRASNGVLGGRPKTVGSYTITVQFTAKTVTTGTNHKRTVTNIQASQTYTLTVSQ